MANKNTAIEYLFLSIVTIIAISGFIYFFQGYHSSLTRAQDNSLSLKIKLQGERYPLSTTKTMVILYNPQGKIRQYDDIIFSYQSDKLFEGSVTFDPNFDYNGLYAIYIKPNNYFGQIFCSSTLHGKDCTSPQFIFKQNANSIDLSQQSFFGGDIAPYNGKVDAYDISKIMASLGKTTDPSTDVNNDGMTNSLDYMLALYSLGNNIKDDAVSLVFVAATPTPTATPSATITPSPTIVPTTINTPTPLLSPTVAITLTPTPGAGGTCHGVPIIGEAFDVSNGITPCECEGSDCYITNCVCPTGICVCNISSAAGASCTNQGNITFTKCNK